MPCNGARSDDSFASFVLLLVVVLGLLSRTSMSTTTRTIFLGEERWNPTW